MKQKVKDKIEKRSTELLVLSAIIVVGGAVATASSSNILDAGASSSDGLVAEYRFDTEARNTAYDTAGNNDGTINGASWTSGVKGGALKFDGNDDYVDAGDLDYISSGESGNYTTSVWVRFDTIKQSFFFGDEQSGNGGVMMQIDSSGYLQTYFNGYHTSSYQVSPDRWYHVSLVQNSSGISLFVNGKYIERLTSQNHVETSYNTQIGRFGGDGRYIDGKMDNIKVYSKGLKHSQIKSIYNSGSWRIGTVTDEDDPSKVAEFSFQHQNSSHVLDTSGYNNHGERVNGVGQETSVGCKVGRCYSFDGSDDGVHTGTNTLYNEPEGTWMAWVNPDTISSSGFGHAQPNAVISATSGSCDDAYALMVGNSNQAGAHVDDGPSNNVISGGNIGENEWNHLTATYDSGIFQLYVNGMLVANTSTEGTAIEDQTCPEYIGNRDNAVNYFNGKIDQVKLFNRSLSQAEIIEKTEGLESNGAVLDMRFDSGGGDHVEDYSGEGNHGEAYNGVSWSDGVKGQALSFDGNDDMTLVSDKESLKYKGGDMTISGWYYETGDSQGEIFSKPWNGGGDYNYGLEKSSSNKLQLSAGGDSASVDVQSGQVGLDEWHHFTAVLNEPEFKLYVDGELEGSKTKSVSTWIPSGGDENRELTLGSLYPYGEWSGNTGFSYNGRLDEFKILPYAASKSKVEELYVEGKPQLNSKQDESSDLQDDLILSQTFDRVETCGQSDTVSCPSGMSGEVSVDESDEVNHAELVNDPAMKGAKGCKVGGCLGFDGSDDYVEVSDDTSMESGDITISLWLKTKESQSNTGLISKKKNISSGYHVRLEGNTVGSFIGDGSTYYGTNSDTTITDGKWHNVVVTYKAGGMTRIYIDGSQEGSSSAGGDIAYGNNPLRIARGVNYLSGNYFNGSIDQTQVYNRSLSRDEVWKLYTRGRDRKDGMAGPVAHYRFNGDNSENLAPNPSFSSGAGPPYKWIQQEGSSSVVDHSRGDIRTGSKAIEFPGDGNYHRIRSETFSVTPGEEIYGRCYTKSNSGGSFYFGLDWIGAGYDYFDHPQTSSWTLTDNVALTVPDGVQEAGVWLFNYRDNSGKVWVDDCVVSRSPIGNTTEEITVPSGYDASSEGNQGISYGTTIVDGKIGESLYFDGTGSRVEIGEEIDYSKNSVTVGAWVKQTGTASSPYQRVTDGGITYWVDDRDGDTCVRLTADEGGNSAQTCFSTELDKDKWYHILFTYDSATSEIKLYINGELHGTSSYYSGYMNGVTNSLTIGNTAGGGRPWKGKIDDVRIYPYALTSEQVKQVKNGGAVSVG